MELTLNELKKSDYFKLMTAGAVLTGGCAMLPGIIDLAESIFDMPVKLGVPNTVNSVTAEVNKPNHATGVGLILYGYQHKAEAEGLASPNETHLFDKIADRMKRWFGVVNRAA